MVYRIVPFLMTLNDPNPDLKGTPLFDVNISETVQERWDTIILTRI